MKPDDVTDEMIVEISEAIQRDPDGWDCVDTKELVAAVVNVAAQSQLAALRKRVEEMEGKGKAWDSLVEVWTRDSDGFCLDSVRDEINSQIACLSKSIQDRA